MPDLDREKNNPYQFLSRISTGELKRILKEDFESEDSSTLENDEFITCVMEVIAQREEEDPEFPHFDVDAGWNDFQQNYRPEGEGPALEHDKTASSEFIENRGEGEQADLETPQPKRAFYRILRFLALAALVASLCAIATSAFELNIFKMVAQWTQEIFQFKSENVPQQGVEVLEGTQLDQDQTLETALKEQGISASVSPTWVPEGFEFSGMKVYDDITEPLLSALYENASTDCSIIVSVIIHQTPKSSIHEKDESPVNTYLTNDVEHYIMKNNKSFTATWLVDNLECTITGQISEDELKAMIDSIYGGNSN